VADVACLSDDVLLGHKRGHFEVGIGPSTPFIFERDEIRRNLRRETMAPTKRAGMTTQVEHDPPHAIATGIFRPNGTRGLGSALGDRGGAVADVMRQPCPIVKLVLDRFVDPNAAALLCNKGGLQLGEQAFATGKGNHHAAQLSN